jgi:hypothetical protein
MIQWVAASSASIFATCSGAVRSTPVRNRLTVVPARETKKLSKFHLMGAPPAPAESPPEPLHSPHALRHESLMNCGSAQAGGEVGTDGPIREKNDCRWVKKAALGSAFYPLRAYSSRILPLRPKPRNPG